jgi:hypothetical protein
VRRTSALPTLFASGILALSGCGGNSTSSTPPQSPAAPTSAAPSSSAPANSASASTGTSAPANVVGTVTLTKGKPQGGVQRISTHAGQPAVLMVTSDTATEIHVHGVDRTVAIPANSATPVDVSQPASGSYEVEDHGSDALLVQLRVS